MTGMHFLGAAFSCFPQARCYFAGNLDFFQVAVTALQDMTLCFLIGNCAFHFLMREVCFWNGQARCHVLLTWW